MTNVHRSVFLKELKEHYPDLTGKLNSQESVFFREVAVFLEYVQHHIDNEDQENTKILLQRIDRYYTSGDRALSELIRNGVCEDMRFEDTKTKNRAWALLYLSPSLVKERESWISSMGEWARK